MKTKIKTRDDLITKAVADFKKDHKDWKKLDQDELYGVESYVDALLYEDEYKHLAPGYGKGGNDELVLERFTFSAIRDLGKGKRHTCDPLYDDAFGGRDE